MTWPVSDVETDRVSVVLQDRPVVGLHRGLVDTLVAAGRNGRGVQVVTPPTSRVTVPLRMALTGGDNRWVVQGGERRYFDGFSGEPLHWSGGAFTGYDDSAGMNPGGEPPGTGGSEHPGTGYDAGSIYDADAPHDAGLPGVDDPPPGEQQLWLNVQLHHTRPPTAFGLAVESACRALTGKPPAGWGTAEPVAERWRPTELSVLAANRGPDPTFLTVVGHGARPMVGALEISAGPAGVTEATTLVIGHRAGDFPDPVELAGVAAALAGEHPLSSLFAICRAGRADLTCSPYPVGRGVPVGLAIGPEALGGADPAEALALLPGARAIGTPRRPVVWYDLDGRWETFDRVAERFDAEIPA